MKKIQKLFSFLDKKTHYINIFWNHIKKYFPIFSSMLLIFLVIFFIFRVFNEKPFFITAVISNDIKQIVFALNQIDKDCSILSIDNEKNYVDFLTVKKFSGSEVGCLNLAYPKNWHGPYLKDNPTVQGKLYEMIKTKEGVFIVPGDGVKLPNGLIMGKDIKINFNSSIFDMIKNGGRLNYQGLKFAKKLEFKIGDWGNKQLQEKEIEDISDMLKEFSEAIPFTHNNQTEPYNC